VCRYRGYTLHRYRDTEDTDSALGTGDTLCMGTGGSLKRYRGTLHVKAVYCVGIEVEEGKGHCMNAQCTLGRGTA
jgi:hypothetical protein